MKRSDTTSRFRKTCPGIRTLTCSHVVHTAAHSTPSGEDRQIYISPHSRGGLFFPGSARTIASTSSFLPHSRTRMDRASRSADRSFRPVRMFLLRVSSNCPDHGSSRGRRTAAADSVQKRSNINGKSHLQIVLKLADIPPALHLLPFRYHIHHQYKRL